MNLWTSIFVVIRGKIIVNLLKNHNKSQCCNKGLVKELDVYTVAAAIEQMCKVSKPFEGQ